MKPIVLSAHAMEQLQYRGATIDEVNEAIRTAAWEPAELGRLAAQIDFPYNSIWNKRHYQTKRVRPIFVEEEYEIVVVTIYTYYF